MDEGCRPTLLLDLNLIVTLAVSSAGHQRRVQDMPFIMACVIAY